MTQSVGDQVVVPLFPQRSSTVDAAEVIGTAPQPATRRRPRSTDSSAGDGLARKLRVLAQQIDDLTKSANVDAFIQLDTAARHALAAAHAIDAVDAAAGTSSEHLCAAETGWSGPAEIHPELASRLIKRIFAAGLQLAALQSLLGNGAMSDKAAVVIEELDLVIRDIRWGLQNEVPPGPVQPKGIA